MLAQRPCFILLGRNGDLIQMFPCFKAVAERTGQKPLIIVATEYATLFDGITYAEPYPINDRWYEGVPKARDIARSLGYTKCTFVRWWLDDAEHTKMLEEATKGDLVLQCHGLNWGVDISKWPDYGTSMASRCGFTREEWMALPLVFDRRNASREETLWKVLVGVDKRPVILYKFRGHSSPFPFMSHVMQAINAAYPNVFRFVELDRFMATRIYDFLGMYDRAAGLITADTVTLHLAPASKVPYIAFTVDGWTSSVPKGNCILEVKYSQTLARINAIVKAVASFQNHAVPLLQPVPT